MWSKVFEYIVCAQAIDMDTFLLAQTVCRRLHRLLNSRDVWFHIPPIRASDNTLNLNTYKFMGLKNQGALYI
jgi:hypothetical protein